MRVNLNNSKKGLFSIFILEVLIHKAEMDPKSNVEDDETVASASATTSEKKKPNYPGPKSGVQYPLNVLYCGGNLIIFKGSSVEYSSFI